MGIESRDYYRTDTATPPSVPEPSDGRRPRVVFRYLYLLYGAVLAPMLVWQSSRVSERPFDAGYLMAAITFPAHMAAVWLLFDPRPRSLVRPLQAAVFTGIAGIGLLFAIQHLAGTNGLGVVGRFIAYAYGLTNTSPFSSPLLTFIGYTFGVGLLEELVKALPVIFLLTTGRIHHWRAACLVGLASGIGFGVSEGIWYHESVYNQPAFDFATFQFVATEPVGFTTYLGRFVTCTGSHAILAAIGALILYRRFRDGRGLNPIEVLWALFGVMCLHGLYNSFLSYDHPLAAIGVDVVQFLWLVALVESMARSEAGAIKGPSFSAWLTTVRPALTKKRIGVAAALLAIGAVVFWATTRPVPLPPRPDYDPRTTFVAMLHVHRGWALEAVNRPADARKDFERALALDSACDPAACALARVAGAAGDSTAAMNAYRGILRHRPELVGYGIASADELAKWADSVLGANPADTLGLLMRARVYQEAGDNARAIATLNSILAATPTEVTALLYLGDRYEAVGQFDKARDAYDRAVACGGDLEASARVARARHLIQREDYAGALADCDAAIRLNDSVVPYSLSVLCRLFLRDGTREAEQHLYGYLRKVPENRLALIGEGQLDQTTERLVAANPLAPLSLTIRGDARCVAKRYDAARADATAALRLDRQSLFPRYLSALISFHQNEVEVARSAYRALVRERPDFAAAWLGVALCAHARQEASEEADAALRVARLSPRTMRAYRLRAIGLHGLGSHRRAADCFAIAVGLDGIRDPWERAGTLYYYQFLSAEDAVREFGHRLNRDETDILGLVWRGNAHRAQGNPDAAALDYSEAARRSPNSPLPLLMLGLLKRDTNPDEAIALLGEAIAVGEKWLELPRDMD